MSSRQKLKRIVRLVALRERARDGAQAELAAAQRACETAQARVQGAERRWNEEATKTQDAALDSVHEFGLRRMHLASLRREIELAKEVHEQRLLVERQKIDAAIHAQRELRKMELWGDSEAELLRVEGERADQQLTDELAARIVLHSPSTD